MKIFAIQSPQNTNVNIEIFFLHTIRLISDRFRSILIAFPELKIFNVNMLSGGLFSNAISSPLQTGLMAYGALVEWYWQRETEVLGEVHIRLTYLLTPWCRVLLEQLTGLQLVKKFPAFHGTRRFITALTSVRHLSLSWASPIQSLYPHPTSSKSILIFSTHLRLGFPSGLFPSGFPTKTLYTPLSSPHTRYMNRPSHSS